MSMLIIGKYAHGVARVLWKGLSCKRKEMKNCGRTGIQEVNYKQLDT
jgi:hypothetical protein